MLRQLCRLLPACAAFMAELVASSAIAAPSSPAFELEQVRFENGLSLVMNADHSSPTVAICTVFEVGVRDDPPELPGLAALSAEMLAVPTAESPLAPDVTVTEDFTRLCTEIPASDLTAEIRGVARRSPWAATPADLAAAVERITDRRADAPEAVWRAPSRLFELAFEGHPYERTPNAPVAADRIRLDDVRAFQLRHYRPAAAAVSLVGDFDPGPVRELIAAEFRGARGPAASRTALPERTRQTTERYSAMALAGTTAPAAIYGWVIPNTTTVDHRALELAARLLGSDAELSRAVRDPASAAAVTARVDGLDGPDLLEIRVAAKPGANLDEARNAVDAAIARLRGGGPARSEIEAAKQDIREALALKLTSRIERAGWLAEQTLRTPSADPIATALAPFDAIGSADVRAAVARYLTPTSRTIVEVYPPERRTEPHQTRASAARGRRVERTAVPEAKAGASRVPASQRRDGHVRSLPRSASGQDDRGAGRRRVQ